MEITVKQLKEALNKVKNENEVVYLEAGFGSADIHTLYDVTQSQNGKIILHGDGHYSMDDRDNTDFDYNIPKNTLIKEYEK